MDFLDKSGYVLSDIDKATHIAFTGVYYRIGDFPANGTCAVRSGRFWYLYYESRLELAVKLDRLAAANGYLVRKREPVKLSVSHVERGYPHPIFGVDIKFRPDFYPEHDAFRVTIEGL